MRTTLRAALVLVALLKLVAGCAQPAAVRQARSEEAQGLALLAENLAQPGEATLREEEVRTLLAENVGPNVGAQANGIVVGIVDERGPRVIAAGATGTTRPLDGDTLFLIGSITKVFTALLLQDMVDRGEMTLDDPVQKYLPASVTMPTRGGKAITLFDLATHTSGLPRDWAGLSRATGGGKVDTIEQMYAALSRYKLPRDPGSRYEYSNLGGSLLGHVIALKAGKDYETLLVERICKPLGMESTRVALTPGLENRLARGHAFPGRPVPAPRGRAPAVMPGSGSIKSTANDLLKFVSANLGLNETPLTPVMRKVWSVQRTPGGRTGRLIWVEDTGVILHGGLVPGFRANLGFDPAKQRGAVILANCSSARLPVALLGPLIKGRSARPPKTAPTPPDVSQLDRYVGEYRFDTPTGFVTVRREGERLIVQTWNGEPRYPMPFARVELFPLSQTVFYSAMWNARVTFRGRDSAGRATRLVVNTPGQGAKEWTGKRLSAAASLPTTLPTTNPVADPDLLEAYVGQYRPALLGVFRVGPTLHVYRKRDELGDHLMAWIEGAGETGGEDARGELYPFWNDATFFNPDLDDSSITFRRIRAGKAMGISVQLSNGSNIRGVRTADEPDPPPSSK